ncbi:CzcE family metal-binding protein [Cupriavidus necator]|uniref:CzcE family metal-binding protein n=1 Tax=Cupriavidus necator TaxID=106590 RepID=UPI00339D9357
MNTLAPRQRSPAPSCTRGEITWMFAEFIHGKSVDLGVLFPALPNAQGVRVYIERSKLYTGG